MVAVAPPQEQAISPVAPVDVNSPAPVPTVDLTQSQVPDIHTRYEIAAESGDPESMYSLASHLKGTPMENALTRNADKMKNYLTSFEKDIEPIKKAGGTATPEGRIAAGKAWETIADKPEKMRAFVEMLMGNPNWRKFVTGGTPTTEIIYDKNNGDQLFRTFNELGQTMSVTDVSGKQLSPKEIQERGGLVRSLDHSIGYQMEKERAQFDVKAFNASEAATNDYVAKSPEMKRLYLEMNQRLLNLRGSGLSDAQRDMIGTFTSRSSGFSKSMSDGFNVLRQYTDNKNISLSSSEQKTLSATMDKLGLKFGGDGSITDKNGKTVTKTDLDQLQKQFSNSANFEKNFNQSKEDFLNNEVFKNLGGAEKKSLSRILDLQGQLEKTQLELGSKHGSLPFLINPQSFQIGDQFDRGIASALIGEFNADATEMFSKWRKEKLAQYPKGKIPRPGELEAAFSRTPEFRALRESFSQKQIDILSRPGEAAPSPEPLAPEIKEQQQRVLESPVLGETEQKLTSDIQKAKRGSPKERSMKKSEEQGPELIGRTPDGKKVYKLPNGRTVTEK